MTAPIIIYRPLLHLQPLDDEGDDDGAAVDVSCDMQSVELSPDTPTIDVQTFCGSFSVADDVQIEVTFEVAVNEDTDTRWSALVGRTVRAELYDRTGASRYRHFDTQIVLNPSLYGTTTPGEARTVSFTPPILSAVAWATAAT